LNETKQIDDHLFGLAAPADALLFDANMILDSNLRDKVMLQRQSHVLIQQYGRKMLKAEIEAVHQNLFNNPERQSFADRMRRFFR
jgi:hypothetical protein